MGNFFNQGPTILKLIVRVRIYRIFIIIAMRFSKKRTTLHCVESYLYDIILVNKKIFSEE